MTRGRRAALAALFVCAAVAADARTLRFASQQDPQTVDPHAANLLVSARLTQQIYDTLLGSKLADPNWTGG